MARLEILHESVVFTNANPGYRYIMAANSCPVQISENEMICTYNCGQAYNAVDLAIYMSRSHDGGATWSSHRLIHNDSGDERRYSYHAPMTTRLRDGSLVIFTFRCDRSDPELPLYHETNGGMVPTQNLLFRSYDNGETWERPQHIPTPPGWVITPSSPIIEMPDGRWLLHFDKWHGYHESGPYRPVSALITTHDQGATWGPPQLFADGANVGKGFWHARLTPLAEGGFFTMFWTAETVHFQNLPLHWSVGSEDASQWSAPQSTNIPGQTNWAVDLGQKKMAAIYTNRESERPGLYVVLSDDRGNHWDLTKRVQVWDAVGRDKLGVSSANSYPRSHDSIAFGAPTAVRLADGDIFVSFWCTEMSITHVRCTRLRLV